MVWAGFYISTLVSMLALGITKKIKKQLIYWLLLNIAMTIVFICVFLGFTAPVLLAVIVSVVLFLLCIAAIPIAYIYIEGHLPTYVKAICGIAIIGGVIILALMGFILQIASNFAIFTFIMISLYVILFIVATVIFYQKQADKYEQPHVYSAFGEPIYRFDSGSEQIKSSKNHKVLYDVASVVLVVYAAAVSLFFQEKQYSIYVLGYYCSMTFIQNILFSLKTYN